MAMSLRYEGKPSRPCRREIEARGITGTDRRLSIAAWDTDDDVVDNLLVVFAVGASLVQVANAAPAAMERRKVTEKVTRILD